MHLRRKFSDRIVAVAEDDLADNNNYFKITVE